MRLIKPNWRTYGLGWYQHDYKGRKVNFHTGSLSGLTAITAQLPEEKLGVYIFGNYDHAEVRHVLMYKTLDCFALGETRDWNAEFKTLYNGLAEKEKKRKQDFEARRVPNTSPSLPLEKYKGKYTSPLYGEAYVAVDGNKVSVNINDVLKGTLAHFNYDTFTATFDKAWYGKVMAQFTLNNSGKADLLIVDGMEFQKSGL
jgi:hypothetical protein